MIFVRNKFCFIHIFRSAGMAVTSALLSGVRPGEEFFATTYAKYNQKQLWRHSTAHEISEGVTFDEFQKVYKFAIVRNPFDVFSSFYRLCLHDLKHFQGEWDSDWRATCEEFACCPLETAIANQFWFLHPEGGFWRFHVGGHAVAPIRYEELDQRWPDIVGYCKLPGTTKLPILLRPFADDPYWSRDAIETVLDLCREDFELFGWRIPQAVTT